VTASRLPQLIKSLMRRLCGGQQETSEVRKDASPQLQGERARVYLEQTGEGQSLMQAVTAARFGLKWQECAPFGGESGGGYLGISAIRI
jgi:hypothetical protein